MADNGVPAAGGPRPLRGHRGAVQSTLVSMLAGTSAFGVTLIATAVVGTTCVGGIVVRTTRDLVQTLLRLNVGTAQRNAWDATCADLQRRVEER